MAIPPDFTKPFPYEDCPKWCDKTLCEFQLCPRIQQDPMRRSMARYCTSEYLAHERKRKRGKK